MPDILPDVLADGLRIIFCGTAASRLSAAKGYNYGNPGNLFWPTVKKVGLLPPDFSPQNFRDLPRYGLGLTDLAKGNIGNDDELEQSAFDVARLTRTLKQYQPAILAFTSKTGAEVYLGHKVSYGLQPERVGLTQLFVLPSPSGRARRFFDESWWHQLADLV